MGELAAITGYGKLLFPSILSEERAISDNTMNAALRRLGYDKSQMTAHGFARWQHPFERDREVAPRRDRAPAGARVGMVVRRLCAGSIGRAGPNDAVLVRLPRQLRLGPKVVKGRFRRAA
jgi:hypothetical protein